jgi:hypothetical protein
MDLADDVLLAEMAIYASTNSCQVPRDDLLRLVWLAGWGPETTLYQGIAAEGDSVLVLREGLLEFIRLAKAA